MAITYLTATATARRFGVHRSRVKQWCQAGRLAGAIKPGREWLIPSTSPRPEKILPGRKASAA